jgi:hypothetical protein
MRYRPTCWIPPVNFTDRPFADAWGVAAVVRLLAVMVMVVSASSCVCDSPYGRDCRGQCIAGGGQNNPSYCGPSGQCTDCTKASLPPHTVPVCGNPAGSCSSLCELGWTHCEGRAGGGCETNITDPGNCGGCGNSCASGQSCVAMESNGPWFCSHACSEPAVKAACADAFARVGPLCIGTLSGAGELCDLAVLRGRDPAEWCPMSILFQK